MKRHKTRAIKIISFLLAFFILLNNMLFPLDAGMLLFNNAANNTVMAAGYDFDSSGFTVYPVEGTLRQTIESVAATGSTGSPGCGRIILDADYTENIEIPDNTMIEIDLNGHVLHPFGNSARSNILVYGTLKLTDTSEDNSGALVSDGVTDISGIEVLAAESLYLPRDQ